MDYYKTSVSIVHIGGAYPAVSLNFQPSPRVKNSIVSCTCSLSKPNPTIFFFLVLGGHVWLQELSIPEM